MFRRKRKICFSVWVVVALGPFRCLRGPALPGFGAGRVRKLFEVPSMFRRCSVDVPLFRRCSVDCSVDVPSMRLAPRPLPWAAGIFGVALGVLMHNGKAAANAIIGIVLIS